MEILKFEYDSLDTEDSKNLFASKNISTTNTEEPSETKPSCEEIPKYLQQEQIALKKLCDEVFIKQVFTLLEHQSTVDREDLEVFMQEFILESLGHKAIHMLFTETETPEQKSLAQNISHRILDDITEINNTMDLILQIKDRLSKYITLVLKLIDDVLLLQVKFRDLSNIYYPGNVVPITTPEEALFDLSLLKEGIELPPSRTSQVL